MTRTRGHPGMNRPLLPSELFWRKTKHLAQRLLRQVFCHNDGGETTYNLSEPHIAIVQETNWHSKLSAAANSSTLQHTVQLVPLHTTHNGSSSKNLFAERIRNKSILCFFGKFAAAKTSETNFSLPLH